MGLCRAAVADRADGSGSIITNSTSAGAFSFELFDMGTVRHLSGSCSPVAGLSPTFCPLSDAFSSVQFIHSTTSGSGSEEQSVPETWGNFPEPPSAGWRSRSSPSCVSPGVGMQCGLHQGTPFMMYHALTNAQKETGDTTVSFSHIFTYYIKMVKFLRHNCNY